MDINGDRGYTTGMKNKELILLALATALVTGTEMTISFVKLNGEPRTVSGRVELHTLTGEVLIRTAEGVKTVKPDRITSINRASL